MERQDGSMVLLAIFVSRFEASLVASMLRGYGLLVSVDGEAHASVLYQSLALGGHRLRVARADYTVASEILRQAGVVDRSYIAPPPSRALVMLVAMFAVFYSVSIGLGVVAGSAPISSLLYIPLGVYSVPVDPKERPDYFLADPEAG